MSGPAQATKKSDKGANSREASPADALSSALTNFLRTRPPETRTVLCELAGAVLTALESPKDPASANSSEPPKPAAGPRAKQFTVTKRALRNLEVGQLVSHPMLDRPYALDGKLFAARKDGKIPLGATLLDQPADAPRIFAVVEVLKDREFMVQKVDAFGRIESASPRIRVAVQRIVPYSVDSLFAVDAK